MASMWHHAAMRLPSGLLSRLLTGAMLFSALGAAVGWVSGDVGYETASGACTGLVVGTIWFFDLRRTAKYRRSFDPADRTLTRPQPARATRPIRRRYGVEPILQVLLVVLVAGMIAMAVFLPQQPDVPAGIVWFLWVFTLIPAACLVWLVLRSTTIGPLGVIVRSNLKSQTVSWPELAEVRWHRTGFGDVLLLCTHDGREIKVVGAEVHRTGVGRRRMERVLADIGHAWAVHARLE
jgi:hypothetical protein